MASTVISLQDLVCQAVNAFKIQYESDPEICGSAPGRVNLIGEHTDYNDGFVFPMALPMVTVIVGRKTNNPVCRITTCLDNADKPKNIEFPVPTADKPLQKGKPAWANYVKGVIANFKGPLDQGFDALIVTSVPVGGGLSSSASLEVAFYTFLEEITGHSGSPFEKALACQKAEHDYAGTPCGIMDQFISTMGKAHNALLIDCRSMEATLIPLKDEELVFLVANTNVHHDLSTGEYASRRADCEAAAKALGKKSLRDANMDELDSKKGQMDERVYRRARHVIGEIRRTQEAVAALRTQDYVTFGLLMYESHDSLKNDYNVSCSELDELVAAAREVGGVYGARMTGGGFGGCTITLLKKDAVDETIKHMKERYSGNATFYVSTASDGSKVIPLTAN